MAHHGGPIRHYESFRTETRPPRVAPPRHACDSQFHVFGPADRYPIRAEAAYFSPEATIGAALRMHRALGIERGVIVQATTYGTDFTVMLDALTEAGPGYRGCAVIDDAMPDKALAKLHDAGVRGARFNFGKYLNLVPSDRTFERSVDRIRDLGWYVKIHARGDELLRIAPLLHRLDVPAVIDHFGVADIGLGLDQPVVWLMMDLLSKGNWWVMLSVGERRSKAGYPWDDVLPFAHRFMDAAPDRMIWGTNWPHPLITDPQAMPHEADQLELACRYAVTEERIHALLVSNPAKLFGFD